MAMTKSPCEGYTETPPSTYGPSGGGEVGGSDLGDKATSGGLMPMVTGITLKDVGTATVKTPVEKTS